MKIHCLPVFADSVYCTVRCLWQFCFLCSAPSLRAAGEGSFWRIDVRGPACGGSVPFMKSCLLREALSFLLIEIEGTDKGCGEDAKAPGSSSRGHPWRKCLLHEHLAGPKWGEPRTVEKHCWKTVPANLGSYPHFRNEESKAELGVLKRSATIKWAQCQAPEFFKVIFSLSPSLIQPTSTYSDASRRMNIQHVQRVLISVPVDSSKY